MSRRLIRFNEVSKMLGGISRMTLHRIEKDDNNNFPSRRKLASNRSAAWYEDEVEQWINSREKITVGK